MTGEITLRGRVLAVGGVKEKAVAAHSHRIVDVVLPRANERDAQELPQEVRDAMRWHPVVTMDEVLQLALRRDRAPTEPPSPIASPPRPARRRRRRAEAEAS